MKEQIISVEMQRLGQKIRYRRRKSLMTIRQLAEKVGVAPSCLQAWEIGRREPRYTHLLRLEKTLNLGVLSKRRAKKKKESLQVESETTPA